MPISGRGGASPELHAASHENGGTDEVNVAGLNGELADAQPVAVSKNSGAVVGTRSELNLIEGANITLTIADDAGNDEVDITIAAAASGGDLSQWFPASDPNSNIGNHPSMLMPNGQETTIRQSFIIPHTISSISKAYAIIIPAASGNLDWEVQTDFGTFGEAYNLNSDTDSGTTAVTNTELENIDISAALTGAAADDIVGIEFLRDGEDATDTVDADVHFIGIYIEGT